MVERDLVTEALASDILALSALLSAADHYWWPASELRRTITSNTRSFSHFSMLLGFGTNIPVATTGTITTEGVTAIIMYPKRPEARRPPGMEVLESCPAERDARSLKEILQNPPQCPEDYAVDLLALFGKVNLGEISSITIVRWVIRRGWSTLKARMQRSKNDFQDDLFEYMEAWSPYDNDDVPEQVVTMPITRSIYETYSYLPVMLTDQCATFLLKKTTASMLIATMARIFKDIRKTIEDHNTNQSEAAKSLLEPFIWLHSLLASRHVEALMTRTSLRIALLPRPDGAKSEHTDGWEPLPGRNGKPDSDYGLRYLRMLVSCVTSVFYLSNPEILPLVAKTNATIISPTASLYNAASEHRRVVEAIGDDIKRDAPPNALWLDNALGWIASCADGAMHGDREACCLHAEASLMALACEERLSHGGGNTDFNKYGPAFSGLARTPIGISGKCCPLCLRLTQLLNAHFASLGDLEALVFSFPETHGKVLPWDVPLFGIPQSVLKQLRDELRERFVQTAVAAGMLEVSKMDDQRIYAADDFLEEQGIIPLSDVFTW